jgi:hypothetical protein
LVRQHFQFAGHTVGSGLDRSPNPRPTWMAVRFLDGVAGAGKPWPLVRFGPEKRTSRKRRGKPAWSRG